jgi:hypothetical protein
MIPATGGTSMKVKAVNGFARILKAEGIPWVNASRSARSAFASA